MVVLINYFVNAGYIVLINNKDGIISDGDLCFFIGVGHNQMLGDSLLADNLFGEGLIRYLEILTVYLLDYRRYFLAKLKEHTI